MLMAFDSMPTPYTTAGSLPSGASARLDLPIRVRVSAFSSMVSVMTWSFLLVDMPRRSELEIRVEELGNRIVVIDVLDGVRKERRHGQHMHLTVLALFRDGDRVCHHDLGDRRGLEPLVGGWREDAVRRGHVDRLGPVLHERLRALGDGTGGVDHVVGDDAGLSLNLADDVRDLSHVMLRATLVHDCERRAEHVSELLAHLHPADVR